MRGFTLIFAEVVYTQPALSSVFGLAAVPSVVCLLLSLWRPWGTFLALVPAAASVVFTLSWLRDPDEGSAILRDFGQGYVTQCYIAGLLPMAAVGIGFAFGYLLQRKRRAVA
jgi:hypothetical protein